MRFWPPTIGGRAPPRRRTFQTPSSSFTGLVSRADAAAKPALPSHGSGADRGAPGSRRLAVRAEVGRLPRRAREPEGRASSLEPKRAAVASLFPRAERGRGPAPGRKRPRRRDRDRAGWPARLRRDADAPAPGREPRQEARRRDPGPVHRLRHPRLEGRAAAPAHARQTTPRAREAGEEVPPLADDARPIAGGGLVEAPGGRRAGR